MHATDQTFQILLSQLLEKVEDRCPECGSEQYVWQQKNKDGTERCAPTCWSCGYKMLKKHGTTSQSTTFSREFYGTYTKIFSSRVLNC
ncbi:DNA replication protein [Enterococcus sp. AZ112]